MKDKNLDVKTLIKAGIVSIVTAIGVGLIMTTSIAKADEPKRPPSPKMAYERCVNDDTTTVMQGDTIHMDIEWDSYGDDPNGPFHNFPTKCTYTSNSDYKVQFEINSSIAPYAPAFIYLDKENPVTLMFAGVSNPGHPVVNTFFRGCMGYSGCPTDNKLVTATVHCVYDPAI